MLAGRGHELGQRREDRQGRAGAVGEPVARLAARPRLFGFVKLIGGVHEHFGRAGELLGGPLRPRALPWSRPPGARTVPA
jgi:hypothetical protein